jgi:hypothetical protein
MLAIIAPSTAERHKWVAERFTAWQPLEKKVAARYRADDACSYPGMRQHSVHFAFVARHSPVGVMNERQPFNILAELMILERREARVVDGRGGQ